MVGLMGVSASLGLASGVGRAIRQHGEETYPHECCGALVGSAGVARVAVPLPNTTEEGPRRRFLVRPSDYQLAEKRAAELGGDLLGFYHSHPDHPARPSQFDLDHAWPTFAYVIVAVGSGASGDMTVWFLKEDRSSFDEGELNGDEDSDSDTAAAVHG
jgi:proteasome lid subunit RPN8/RPN11